MHVRLSRLIASLIACAPPAWATTIYVDASFPAYETYSRASAIPMPIGLDAFQVFGSGENVAADPTTSTAYFIPTPPSSTTSVPGATASITAGSYSTAASTTFSSNHVYAQGGSFVSTEMGASSVSGWYDQVTINGGSGTGLAHFTVQLNGIVDVGALKGELSYFLRSSSVHPSLIGTQNVVSFNALSAFQPPLWTSSFGWSEAPITAYTLGTSPYNDTSILFPTERPSTNAGPSGIASDLAGIPAITDPDYQLGVDDGMGFGGFYVPDWVLTPGTEQSVGVILHGSLEFIYGEPFYLISALSANLLDPVIMQDYCGLFAENVCAAGPTDGTGTTTLDFSNSADLVNIALPTGATASFASGNAYNVTNVPEPSSIALLGLGIVGMGLIGRHARRAE